MAQVLGTAGKYVIEEATRRRRRMIVFAFMVMATAGAIAGVAVALSLPVRAAPQRLLLAASTCLPLALWALYKWAVPRLDASEGERLNMEKGLRGEGRVAQELARLPDEFHVIHDIGIGCGNLDHVVIGPTGVFVLETKDWRGIVSADGAGELLLNSKPLDEPYVKHFVARVMQTRDRVMHAAPGLVPYFQAVFVFTAASVEAKWGTTGKANCIREDQLFRYIVESKPHKTLSRRDVTRLTAAFQHLFVRVPR